jgi:SAM-dependent methyltransferase
MRPPLAKECFDLIHSAGVLHHTPDTHGTFKTLRKLLRPGGTFYVWLYKYEARVTPVVNAFRRVTTRMSASAFARLSRVMSVPFIVFCASVNKLGVRSYPRMSRRESALALMDIFGAPYAHYHDFEEVEGWYRAEGFEEIWGCNDGRRGFGVCGRLSAKASEEASTNQSERQLTLAKG